MGIELTTRASHACAPTLRRPQRYFFIIMKLSALTSSVPNLTFLNRKFFSTFSGTNFEECKQYDIAALYKGLYESFNIFVMVGHE